MHIFSCKSWLWVYTLLSSIVPTLAVLKNRTIDDFYGDEHTGVLPSYSPQMVFNKGQDCSSCMVSKAVDVTQVHNGTWTEATNTGSNDLIISFPFNGTAIYVFCIIPNYISQGVTTMADLDFYIDGAYVGNYLHKPDNSSHMSYHVPVYTNAGLSDSNHTFEIRPQADASLGNDGHSLVMFDYAVYSYDDEQRSLVTNPSSKRKPPIAAIIGGILVAQVVLVGGLILIWLRRRNCLRPRVKSVRDSTVTIDTLERGTRIISPPPAPPAYSTVPVVQPQPQPQPNISLAYDTVIPDVKKSS